MGKVILRPSKGMLLGLRGYLAATGLVALATLLKSLAEPDIIPADVPITYIAAIVLTATFFELGPSLFACILAVLAFDFFFVAPAHTLTFGIQEYPILAIFLLTGGLITYLSSNLRRKSEQAESERQRLNEVLEMLPVYVALLSPDYHVPFANRFFRERFGDSHGKRCFEYLFGRTEPCEVCDTYLVLQTKQPHRWEWVGPDGHNYDIFDFPFTDAGGSPLIMEVGIDVTNQKRAQEALVAARDELEMRVHQRTEELRVANRELEAFSYSVSHDLRAPLRSIDGFSLALLEDHAEQLDDQGRDHLHRVRAASQTMGELIDDMLELSKVTRAEIHQERVDLSSMAHRIAQVLHDSEPRRRVEFCIAPGLFVYGDASLLNAALGNLLDNAWKFTSRTDAAKIEFGAANENGQSVYFVRDNGAGFDMNHVGKLFEPFRRLHSKDEFPGTGIGLATVKRIFNRHGGRVWAEGNVGTGATFYFTLGGHIRGQ